MKLFAGFHPTKLKMFFFYTFSTFVSHLLLAMKMPN